MSKIESRDFWVSGECLDFLTGKSQWTIIETAINKTIYGKCNQKITISWEVPEKVATISESEFEDAAGYFRTHLNEQEYLKLKAKIFKDKV